jgi:hypothetical protein
MPFMINEMEGSENKKPSAFWGGLTPPAWLLLRATSAYMQTTLPRMAGWCGRQPIS